VSTTNSFLKSGNLVSMLAAFTIIAELLYLAIFGLNSVYSIVSLTLISLIFMQGIVAFIFYYTALKSILMLIDVPIGLLIEAMAIYFLFLHKFLGLELILIGYISEPIAGTVLFKYFYKINRIYSLMFFIGAIVFTLGLPLYVVNVPYVAIIGDIVKIFGLLKLRKCI